MTKSKAEWRQEYGDAAPAGGGGAIAEALRRLAPYRQCRRIFVAPAPALAQIRINALLDGKELIMPGPGLKEGFYRLRPFVVPFTKLAMAVSHKGLPLLGQLIHHQELPGLAIEVLITDALAVDTRGQCLGDGSGFFDLACAILRQTGALAERPAIWAAAVPHRPELLPTDPWDVRVQGLIEAHGLFAFPPGHEIPAIDWPSLPQQRIKKVTPLWKEWERQARTG